MRDTLRDIYDAVDEFFGGLGSRRITTYSAACAYYLFMSLVPVIMLLVSALQFTPLTRDVVLDAVAEYVPESLYEIVDYIVTSIYNGGRTALTVSILLTLWSASACMKALMRGMDSVYDAHRSEDYIRFSLRACFYMVIFVVILLLSFFVMVYGGKILDLVESSMPSNHSLDFLFTLAKHLRFLVILALLALVFSLLYQWMPASAARSGFQRGSLGGVLLHLLLLRLAVRQVRRLRLHRHHNGGHDLDILLLLFSPSRGLCEPLYRDETGGA